LLLDFHNILSHNLRVAAEGLLMAHYEKLRQNTGASPVAPLYPVDPFDTKVGTHYGPDWVEEDLNGTDQWKFCTRTRIRRRTRTGIRTIRPPAFSFMHKLQMISCFGYPVEVGRLAFLKTFGSNIRPKKDNKLTNEIWNKYYKKVHLGKKATFTPIASELIKAGWSSVFFCRDKVNPVYNPDTDTPTPRNRADRKHHLERAQEAKKGIYTFSPYKLPVYDLMVDYNLKKSRPLSTEQNAKLKKQLDRIKQLEFAFLITADSKSAHCAMVIKDFVYEVHWWAAPSDYRVFDKSVKLKDWIWGSGLLIIPPGQWPKPEKKTPP
jgi:hypothetical protein